MTAANLCREAVLLRFLKVYNGFVYIVLLKHLLIYKITKKLRLDWKPF